jgi:hypothetical protein
MDNGNGAREGEEVRGVVVPMMTITVDPRTGLPSYKCTELPIGFWQMMVGEVARQLEEQRRTATAIALQQQMQRMGEDARIAAALRKGV